MTIDEYVRTVVGPTIHKLRRDRAVVLGATPDDAELIATLCVRNPWLEQAMLAMWTPDEEAIIRDLPYEESVPPA